MPRHVYSKWRKTQALMANAELRSHVPHTKQLSKGSLEDMLARYGMVYIKPDKGSHGIGVGKVQRQGERYCWQEGLRKRCFASYGALYKAIRLSAKGQYLVQKGIVLQTYNKRPFDIRVMVQMSPKQAWEATGVIGRVASPGKVVTNYHSGGMLKEVEALLAGKGMASSAAQRQYEGKLRKLGLKSAHAMKRPFPGVKEIGVDVALDQGLKPWILEVNTSPDPYIFRKLRDKSVFRKIARYAKAYGGMQGTAGKATKIGKEAKLGKGKGKR